MRLGFAGTPEFAAEALRALLAAGSDVALVLTQPDRPAGRGLKLQPSAVKTLALRHDLPVIQPRSLRLDGKFPDDARAAQTALLAAELDCLVVAAYGLILPAWVLQLPARGCINIHASLLPRWRGAAPIHRAIEAGDSETGITLMQMDAGLDTGDKLSVEILPIAADDSTASLHQRLAALGGRLVVEALRGRRTLMHSPQPTEGVSYAHKVEKAEAAIDWSRPASEIERRARAFDPFPGSHFQLHGESVKLWRARAFANPAGTAPAASRLETPGHRSPGQILAAGRGILRVACGDGELELLQLQLPGGRRIDAASFLQARPLTAGTLLV